ncbi:hypothetical protein CPC08DRAFT_823357 [Agrocybe pediades]|nr:hypothetical protein CPC08DRAFT_823357 [Agrocybe pediades]
MLTFNFNIFQKKTKETRDDADMNETTRAFKVDSDYEPYFDSYKEDHHCIVMPVFDVNENPVEPGNFAEKLKPGTLVEITFTLVHYAFQNNNRVYISDTFSAKIEMVSILKEAPAERKSPYKLKGRRPLHTPQSPVKSGPSSGERSAAASAFIPGASKTSGTRARDDDGTDSAEDRPTKRQKTDKENDKGKEKEV